jgi:hypothetical protein
MNNDSKTNEKVCAKGNCESCLMPFNKDQGVRENEKYCSLCFKDGKLCYEGTDLKEFQKVCKESMLRNGIHPIKAWFFTKMIAYAPRWKNR